MSGLLIPGLRIRVALGMNKFKMAPSVSVNFISLVTSCVWLQEEEPQTAHPMSCTWASHIAACMLTGC